MGDSTVVTQAQPVYIYVPCETCSNVIRREATRVREYPEHSGWARNRCRRCRGLEPHSTWASDLGRYGITPERYQEMWDAQKGKCGICCRDLSTLTRRAPIDHDHTCCPPGKKACGRCVRGLLCPRCNSQLETGWANRAAIQHWLRQTLRPVVVSDLDSTICSTLPRHHLRDSQDWVKYALACSGDIPMFGTITMLRVAWPTALVHIVSGRAEEARRQTEQWLTNYAVPYDELSLRATGDESGSAALKVAHINGLKALGYDPQVVFEDWAPAAKTITEMTGVPCVVVNPLYPGMCTCGYATEAIE